MGSAIRRKWINEIETNYMRNDEQSIEWKVGMQCLLQHFRDATEIYGGAGFEKSMLMRPTEATNTASFSDTNRFLVTF